MHRSGLPSFLCHDVSSCPVSYHYTTWLIRQITLWHAHVFLLFSLKQTTQSAICAPTCILKSHTFYLSLGLFSCGRSHLPFHSLSFLCLLVYQASIICLLCCTLSLSPVGAVPCQCLRHISKCIVLCLLYQLLTCSVWCFVCKRLLVHMITVSD